MALAGKQIIAKKEANLVTRYCGKKGEQKMSNFVMHPCMRASNWSFTKCLGFCVTLI